MRKISDTLFDLTPLFPVCSPIRSFESARGKVLISVYDATASSSGEVIGAYSLPVAPFMQDPHGGKYNKLNFNKWYPLDTSKSKGFLSAKGDMGQPHINIVIEFISKKGIKYHLYI